MKGKNTFTQTEINQLEKLIQLRVNADPSEQKTIRNQMRKIGFYGRDDFGILDLKLCDLKQLRQLGRIKVATNIHESSSIKEKPLNTKYKISIDSDENYVLNICDKILGIKSSRQHKFDFLIGDSNRRLPVDSYYEKINLVIEYRELQHTESVSFFDKVDKLTVSGVHRGEQRKIYDQRRRDILPKHGIYLLEISYSNFDFDRRKKIIRNPEIDEKMIRRILKQFV